MKLKCVVGNNKKHMCGGRLVCLVCVERGEEGEYNLILNVFKRGMLGVAV
jgi:hypothetical protein